MYVDNDLAITMQYLDAATANRTTVEAARMRMGVRDLLKPFIADEVSESFEQAICYVAGQAESPPTLKVGVALEAGHQVLGAVCFLPRIPANHSITLIQGLAVVESARRHGIGSSLDDFVCRNAVMYRTPELRIVRPSREALRDGGSSISVAQQFLSAQDYRPVSQKRRLYNKPVDLGVDDEGESQ